MQLSPFAAAIAIARRALPSRTLKTRTPTLAGSRIKLKPSHLQGKIRVISLPDHSGGADCKNHPKSAPPDFDPSPQPTETEELKTSRIITRHTRTTCAPRPFIPRAPGPRPHPESPH